MMTVLFGVCGVAGAIYAVVSLFRGAFKEFLLGLLVGGLGLFAFNHNMSIRTPAMEQSRRAVEAQAKAREELRRDLQRSAELEPAAPDLAALGREVAAFVKAKMDGQGSTAGHAINVTPYVRHPLHSAFDGVLIVDVSEWRSGLAGQVVVFCKSTPNGWIVEGAKSRNFRNAGGRLEHSPKSLEEIGEMYELAVAMFKKQAGR